MLDLYYCIKPYCHLKTLENRFAKLVFYYYNNAEKHEGFLGFENACFRAKAYVIITSLNYFHFYVVLLLCL